MIGQEFNAFLRSQFAELGEEGFYEWWKAQDEHLHDAIEIALTDPAFGLEPHQIMPEGTWRFWFLRMGRGAGKTFAASCAVHVLARDYFPGGNGILVGATHKDVRDTMIEGDSGLVATAPPGFTPQFNKHDNTLVWPNGSKAIIRTADNPEDIRGPTLNWGWADELVKWKSEKSFDNFKRCVRNRHRNGTRMILTTTPMSAKRWIKDIEDEDGCVVSTAPTFANPHMDPAFLRAAEREAESGGNRATEEVLGDWTSGDEGLWTPDLIQSWRLPSNADTKATCASMDRNLLSVDPSKGVGRDQTGICLQGRRGDTVFQIRDATSTASLEGWTQQVVDMAALYLRPQDTILLEENNFHGIVQLVRRMCRDQGVDCKVEPVFSVNHKWKRAQEAFGHCVAGNVRFLNNHPDLEQQLCEWEPDQKDSPDRGDAFCQGVNELMGTKGRGLGVVLLHLDGLTL